MRSRLRLHKMATIALTAVTLALPWAGCSWFTSPPAGQIMVGRPEVFTRQRLLNRRLTEQTWLEDQLAKSTPTETTFQGLQDLRVFAGIYNKTTATFDPLAGQLAVAQNEQAVQTAQNQRNLSAMQQQLDNLRLQQQIDAQSRLGPALEEARLLQQIDTLKKGTAVPAAPAAPSAAPPPQQQPATPPTPTPSTLFSNLPAVPSPADLQRTTAKLTSVEVLRDQLAWRNAVQAALREQELDDTHDLAGLALYTLKFDVSVLPHGAGRGGYAKVEFTLPNNKPTPLKPKDCPSVWKLYYPWMWHFRRDIGVEAVAFQRRLELGLLTEEEKIRLAARAARYKSEYSANQLDRRYVDALTTESAKSGKPSAQNADDAKRGAGFLTLAKYKEAAGEVIDFQELLEIPLESGAYYVPNIPGLKPSVAISECQELKGKLAAFASKIVEVHVPPAVFVADPKEQAQNISDVAALEKFQNIVLSLQAVLPQQGLNASNYTEYIRRSQERFQAILRRPVVVAFTDKGSRFGWILGPRFELGKDGTPQFSHTAVQHSVQVSIVAPGWARMIPIEYTTSWVGLRGNVLDRRHGSIDVQLPGDDSALTARLLADSGTPRLPFIEPPISGGQRQILRFQAGKPAELLIRGQNLWRNPRVFVGGQKADEVLVLPDMEGLTAKFASVTIPPRRAKENPLLDLSVVTSEGRDTLRDAVQIFPDATVPDDAFALAVESPLVINNVKESALILSAPWDATPEGFARVVARIRPLLPGEDGAKVDRPFEELSGTVQLRKQGSKGEFRVPVALPDFSGWLASWRTVLGDNPNSIASGVIMQAELALAKLPGGPLLTAPSADGKPLTFAYFQSKDAMQGVTKVLGASEAKTTFGPGNNFGQAVAIVLGGDDVFDTAHPTLATARQTGITLKLALLSGNAEAGSMSTRLDPKDFAVVRVRPDGTQLPEGSGTAPERQLSRLALIINGLPVSGKDDPRAAVVTWLKERLADGKEHEFRLSLVLPSSSSILIEPPLKLSGKGDPSAATKEKGGN